MKKLGRARKNGDEGPQPELLWKPVTATCAGVAVVSPIPVLAGVPDLVSAWSLDRLLGAPMLAWAMLLIMFALVLVVTITVFFMDSAGA